MKKKLPLPLSIDCGGLSKKHFKMLVEQLQFYFDEVEVWSDVIMASKPRSMGRYGEAWRVFDRYSVKVQ